MVCMCRKDSPAYQLLPELTIDPSKGDLKIEKTVYDAFLGVQCCTADSVLKVHVVNALTRDP